MTIEQKDKWSAYVASVAAFHRSPTVELADACTAAYRSWVEHFIVKPSPGLTLAETIDGLVDEMSTRLVVRRAA